MGRVIRFAALALVGGFLAARPASAQFMPLSHCHQAYPCAIPFGFQFQPDPILAGPFVSPGTTAIAGHVLLKKKPEIALDERPPLSDDVAEAAARAFLRRHPAPKRPEPDPEPPPRE